MNLMSVDGTIATSGAPADYSGMTYEQALIRQQQRDVKSPEEQAAINAALQRGPQAQQQTTPPVINETMTPSEVAETTSTELAKQALGPGTQTTAFLQQPQQEEMLTPEGTMLQEQAPTVTPKTVDTTQIAAVQQPEVTPDLGQVIATEKAANVIENYELSGAKSTLSVNDLIDVEDVSSQALSDQAFAEAATQQLDERATVQYQLSSLFEGIEDGKPLPAWASPTVRKASAIMQQRGLGQSSMAAAAITQAVMESGITIASQDAQMYAAIQLRNLDNQQQATLQNALQVATMDRQNADARTRAAISNAQALLSVDLKELDAEQQANTLKYSALTQAAFKDAAAENARREFNAKNELQVEEFFAQLGVQVDQANINRDVAIRQFNVSQENAYAEFNASMADQREKFNANMSSVINQSNVQWRRQINTANTATLNEANRINVQNRFNASQTALNQLWQQYRDNATFNFSASESAMNRQHEMALAALEISANEKAYTKQQKTDLATSVMRIIASW